MGMPAESLRLLPAPETGAQARRTQPFRLDFPAFMLFYEVFERVFDHLFVIALQRLAVGFAPQVRPPVVMGKVMIRSTPPVRGFAAILLPDSVFVLVIAGAFFFSH